MAKTIEFPTLKLFPQQQEVFNAILTDKKKYAAIMAHRRWGKDVLAFNTTIAYALKNPGNYFYFAPYLRQIKEIIIEGKLHDGRSFLDLVPGELIKPSPLRSKINKSEMSLTLKNGSVIFFRGADNIDGQVGISAMGAVFTEAAIINPVFYKLIRPAILKNINETGKGFLLAISTPRGIHNWFTRMFIEGIPKKSDTPLQKKIKKKWMLRILPASKTVRHDGSPMLSEEFLEEERMELGDDLFHQEYMCSLMASMEGSWYGKYINKAFEEGRIKQYGEYKNNIYNGHYWKHAPTYVAWDWGKRDSTELWFYQINPVNKKPRSIYHFRDSGQGLDYYVLKIKEIQKEMELGYITNVVPHDMEQRMDTNGNVNDPYAPAIKRIEYLRNKGLNCFSLTRKELGEEAWRRITRINTVRKCFDYWEIDEETCTNGIERLRNYIKKYNKSTASYTDEPDHNANDKASDCADSFATGVLYYEKFLKGNTRAGSSVSYDYAGMNFGY